jgi:hypothetical protein
MAFDFNEAREIVEAAKKRGMIRAEGETAPPQAGQTRSDPSHSALPDWLREGLEKPVPPPERE